MGVCFCSVAPLRYWQTGSGGVPVESPEPGPPIPNCGSQTVPLDEVAWMVALPQTTFHVDAGSKSHRPWAEHLKQ